jgi:Putative adhesin
MMKLRLLAGTVLLMVSTAALAADSQFERTLNVSAQPDLYVSTGSGNITIHSGSGDQIHIVGHVHAGWNLFGASGSFGGVKDRIERIVANPPIVQDGNTVKIGEANDHELFNNISIDYDISTPADVALNLHSGSGDIAIEHVGRYLSAATGSGNVVAHGNHGPADLGTGSGEIELEQGGAGDVKAKTGSGNIKIHDLNGDLTARSGSGNIEADGRLTGPANLGSGSGNIKLHLTPDAHFNLEASTGSGDIHVNYPGAPEQGDHSRHHLTGPVNGGGAPLEIRTGSGDVEIDSH